jgi:hypothetical protein
VKIRKKTAMLLSFAVGTTMFATTALAEVSSKSGYVQLKDAVKYTTDSLSEKLSSYTMDVSYVLKSNDKVIVSNNIFNKYDVTKGARENKSVTVQGARKTETYFYADKNGHISYNTENDTYYVQEYGNQREEKLFIDPFKQKEAADIERIIDALIGNLKDYVIVSQNADGSKVLSGSLSEAQIPALVNAVTSFQFKNSFGGYRAARLGVENNMMPVLVEDIFVKEVKGKMTVDKDGLIQSFLGTGVLQGKDEKGKEHNVTFELLGKITDVNTTSVRKPDLTGKKVEKAPEPSYTKMDNLDMFLGTYKNDVIIQKDGKFEKIGEKIVELTSIDNKNVSGTYREEYRTGYEDYAARVKSFSFVAKFKDAPHHAVFSYTNEEGKTMEGSIAMRMELPEVYFYINEQVPNKVINDGRFMRVFD